MIAMLFVLALPPMIRGDTPPVIQVDSRPPIIVVPNKDHPKPMPSPKRVRQEWFDIPGVGRRLITIEESDAVPQTPIPAATSTPSPVVNAWVPSIVGTRVLSAPAIVCRT